MLPYSEVGASIGMFITAGTLLLFTLLVGIELKSDKTPAGNLAFAASVATIIGSDVIITVLSHLIYGR